MYWKSDKYLQNIYKILYKLLFLLKINSNKQVNTF